MSVLAWIILGGVLVAALAAAFERVQRLRRQVDDMNQRLLRLQQTDEERSMYERVRRDKSVLELLHSFLELNDLLERPSGREAGRPGGGERP